MTVMLPRVSMWASERPLPSMPFTRHPHCRSVVMIETCCVTREQNNLFFQP